MKKIIKHIYTLIPFKVKIFSIVKNIVDLPEYVYKHLHFKGEISIKIDDHKSFRMLANGYVEENQLFWGGIENGWEKTSMSLWRKICSHSEIVLDIGANTGVYSLLSKTINPNCKVFAFEPIESTITQLEYNIEINKYDITVLPYALSNYKGEASVFLRENEDFAYSVTVNKSLLSPNTKQKEIKIKTDTLENFISKNNIKKIDLVKLDVETHEPEVIEGMGHYFELYKPDFLIEIWDKESAEKLNKMFKGKGYLYFDIDDKNGKFKKVDTISISSFWNYLICKPETAVKNGLI